MAPDLAEKRTKHVTGLRTGDDPLTPILSRMERGLIVTPRSRDFVDSVCGDGFRHLAGLAFGDRWNQEISLTAYRLDEVLT